MISIFKIHICYFYTKKLQNLIIYYLNMIKNKESVSIYIIRHGNGFHNKPLKLTGGLIFGRIIDSN